MKIKILLLILSITISTINYCSYKALQKTIQATDVQQTNTLLKSTILSTEEKQQLLELAQKVVDETKTPKPTLANSAHAIFGAILLGYGVGFSKIAYLDKNRHINWLNNPRYNNYDWSSNGQAALVRSNSKSYANESYQITLLLGILTSLAGIRELYRWHTNHQQRHTNALAIQALIKIQLV